jgi:hypothetical protein
MLINQVEDPTSRWFPIVHAPLVLTLRHETQRVLGRYVWRLNKQEELRLTISWHPSSSLATIQLNYYKEWEDRNDGMMSAGAARICSLKLKVPSGRSPYIYMLEQLTYWYYKALHQKDEGDLFPFGFRWDVYGNCDQAAACHILDVLEAAT